MVKQITLETAQKETSVDLYDVQSFGVYLRRHGLSKFAVGQVLQEARQRAIVGLFPGHQLFDVIDIGMPGVNRGKKVEILIGYHCAVRMKTSIRIIHLAHVKMAVGLLKKNNRRKSR